MASEETRGGVNIGDIEGSIHGSQIAGRDIVKNIIVVGQFLNFAKVEDLLPEAQQEPDLHSVDQALREYFDSELAGTIEAVGEILEPILVEWQPKRRGAAFPFKRMLPAIASPLIEQLRGFHYWDTFAESGFSAAYKTRYEVIWLDALSQLWQKHTAEQKRFGLADITSTQGFVLQPTDNYQDVQLVYNPQEPYLGEFAGMNNERFRVFMAGLVIDLIRLASEAADDVKFWQDLTDFIKAKP